MASRAPELAEAAVEVAEGAAEVGRDAEAGLVTGIPDEMNMISIREIRGC